MLLHLREVLRPDPRRFKLLKYNVMSRTHWVGVSIGPNIVYISDKRSGILTEHVILGCYMSYSKKYDKLKIVEPRNFFIKRE